VTNKYAFLEELNRCKYIFLRDISEHQENALRLLIEEAIVSDEQVPLDAEIPSLGMGNQIISTDKCGLYEVTFESYIGYSVKNEGLFHHDEGDVVESGVNACVYSKSKYLDFMKLASHAEVLEKPATHYCFHFENHIVDVLSTSQPRVSGVQRRSSKPC